MTPEQHAEHIARMIHQATDECRADVGRVNDPKAQALFETVAEVLAGAKKALDGYAGKREAEWR